MHNVSACIIYKNTEKLFDLVENIKTMNYVIGVQWSRMVEAIEDNNSEVISAVFKT